MGVGVMWSMGTIGSLNECRSQQSRRQPNTAKMRAGLLQEFRQCEDLFLVNASLRREHGTMPAFMNVALF